MSKTMTAAEFTEAMKDYPKKGLPIGGLQRPAIKFTGGVLFVTDSGDLGVGIGKDDRMSAGTMQKSEIDVAIQWLLHTFAAAIPSVAPAPAKEPPAPPPPAEETPQETEEAPPRSGITRLKKAKKKKTSKK